ncbi:hypothetical protein AAHC03_04759 [Spirometra sp. Aus1]
MELRLDDGAEFAVTDGVWGPYSGIAIHASPADARPIGGGLILLPQTDLRDELGASFCLSGQAPACAARLVDLIKPISSLDHARDDGRDGKSTHAHETPTTSLLSIVIGISSNAVVASTVRRPPPAASTASMGGTLAAEAIRMCCGGGYRVALALSASGPPPSRVCRCRSRSYSQRAYFGRCRCCS